MYSPPALPPPPDGLPDLRYDEKVAHLATEYWPYARTGGLGEAVRGIARYQAESGAAKVVFMPLYKSVRAAFPDVTPAGEPFSVNVATRPETARVYYNPTGLDNPRVLFIEHEGYFGRDGIYGDAHGDYRDNHVRFAFLCRAALEWLPRVSPSETILHAHDWHTALASVYLRTQLTGSRYYDDVATVLTVHNAGYQGHYGPNVMNELGLDWSLYHPDRMEWYGKTNILKGGLIYSDMVTTVSPTHARELRTRSGGFGLHDSFSALHDRFVGILNGIDYSIWDPAKDPVIDCCFGMDSLDRKGACKDALQRDFGLPVDRDVPLFGMTARLAEQKGFDILLKTEMFAKLDAQWVFVGEGDKRYEDALHRLTVQYPRRVAATFHFTEEREHRLLAGADFLLMPSQYEPCGLTQMRAQRYGALPVVRRVGGLADTVEDRITGFVFDEYAPWALEEAVRYATEFYRNRPHREKVMREAMSRDFSWWPIVQKYHEVYQRAVAVRAAARASGTAA